MKIVESINFLVENHKMKVKTLKRSGLAQIWVISEEKVQKSV